MGLPSPPVALSNHCSIVYNSTLYTFSPSAFQSIGLREGGAWEELPMGTAVTGGVCVKAVQNGDPSNDAMYVVGGTVSDSSLSSYPGIQRYSFTKKSWDWVSPVVSVTQNRLNHAAIYLNSSASILVYAGSQDGSTGLSSQTFVISTTAPYSVQAYTSSAPPSVNPILLPWNETHAVMVGGSTDNKAVFTFEPTTGWQNLGVVLPEGIHDQTTVSCTTLAGDDGSKILETFNMGVSPNQVSQLVLLNAGGSVANSGQTIRSASRRDLTLADWPAYNGTLAPTSTRSSYSVAQDDVTGQAVISGGNPDDPFCIFDQRANSWVNATKLLQGEVEQISIQSSPTSTSSIIPPSSTSSVAAATSSPTSAETAVAVAGAGQNKSRMLTVLGATLGTIFGIAAVLIIILLLLRWRKQKRRERGNGNVEKDRLSFADRGAEFMREAGGSASGHYPVPKAGSHSSLSIMQGRIGHGHKRGLGALGSDASTAHLVTHKKSPLAYSEPLEMSSIGEKMAHLDTIPTNSPPAYASAQLSPAGPPDGPQHGHSRSSGWSRYFSNNEATNLANMTSGRSTYASERDSAASQSIYTDSRALSQPSQAPPPLELNFTKFDGQRISRVATGSPSLGHSREDLRGQPMQAELARANSVSSSISSLDDYDRSGASREQQHAVTTAWTPVAGNAWNQRPPSSAYTESNRGSAMPVKDTSSSYYPTDNKSSYYARSGISTLYGLYGNKPEQERDSTVTVFPRGVPAEDMKRAPARANPGAGATQNSDMSWLNLGAGTS